MQNLTDIIPILAELNECAVEQIHSDQLEEALDSLLKAEYIIDVLLPTAQKSENKTPKGHVSIPQIEETYT